MSDKSRETAPADEAPGKPLHPAVLPLVVGSLVAFASVFAVLHYVGTRVGATPPAAGGDTRQELGYYEIGGDFTLTDQDGERFDLGALRGQVVWLTFGYTHCPDVCPATLAKMKSVHDALGAGAKRFRAVLVSVDPERDTPQRLKSYVEFFEPEFIGLTGSVDEVSDVARRFGAYFHANPADRESAAGYLVDHTSYGYLIDPNGHVRALLPGDASWKSVLDAVRRVLDQFA